MLSLSTSPRFCRVRSIEAFRFLFLTSLVERSSELSFVLLFLADVVTPFQMHAASAKAGIDVMTNTMGVEWAEYGIRTIGLAPGGIAGTVGGPGGRVFGNNENKVDFRTELLNNCRMVKQHTLMTLSVQPDHSDWSFRRALPRLEPRKRQMLTLMKVHPRI